MFGVFKSPSALLMVQVVGGALALSSLHLAPPASGRLMLVPVRPLPSGALVRDAVARGSRIVGQGPLPDSLIVEGTRGPVLPALIDRGILVLAAPDWACGDRADG